MSPVFPPPHTPPTLDMANYTHPPPQDNMFLYISKATADGGLVHFLSQMLAAPQYFSGYKFRCYIEHGHNEHFEALTDKINNAHHVFNITIELVKMKLNREAIGEDMKRARGLIHLPYADKNPAVLYDALQEGLPVMTNVQSMPFQGLECAPPSAIHIVDGLGPPSQLGKEFQSFLKATSDRNQTKEHIAALVSALSPSSTYSRLCSALQLCEEGEPTEADEKLKDIYHTPTFSRPGLQMSRSSHAANFFGIKCDNSEINSCLRWMYWIGRHRGGAGSVFTSNLYKSKLVSANFKTFSREDCYNPQIRKEFFQLLHPHHETNVIKSQQEREREQVKELMEEMRDWMFKMEGKINKDELWRRQLVKKIGVEGLLEIEEEENKAVKKKQGKKERRRKERKASLEERIQKWHQREKEKEENWSLGGDKWEEDWVMKTKKRREKKNSEEAKEREMRLEKILGLQYNQKQANERLQKQKKENRASYLKRKEQRKREWWSDWDEWDWEIEKWVWSGVAGGVTVWVLGVAVFFYRKVLFKSHYVPSI
uniref:Uncharacterized protein n=1 Tax=Paramoeba aestuarina TaxID=180227 RepID=A0A7S4K9W4_9EUKA